MKKNILSLITLSLVAALGLTSCDLPEDDEELDNGASGDTSVTISINNLNSFYLPSETISWEEVTLTLDFSDPATSDVVLTKAAFDAEELTEEDEFILYTSGLYALSNIEGEDIPEGDYPISYYLVYDEVEYSGSLMSVLITPYPEEYYSVFEFNEPSFAVEYKDNLAQVSEEGGSDNEDKFFMAPLYYEVGDDNPFIYKPELILWDRSYEYGDEGLILNLETVDSYSATATVTHLVEGEEVDVDLSSNEYVSYSNFAFDFTEEAVGEVFTLSISLNNFTSDINSHPIPTYSFTVRVEEGYNVYNAIDLGRMSLFDEENHVTSEGETLSASDFEYGESYYNIFYEPESDETSGEDTPSFVKKEYPSIWADFYEEKGVVDAYEVNGLFIHDDITITENDIPTDFVITREEAETMMGGASLVYDDMVGSVRDGVIIYNHLMDTEDFTLNGNLFTIDASQLKWSMTRVNMAKADSDGVIEFNDNPLIYDTNHTSLSESTATLFAFDGYKLVWENNYYGNYQDPQATAHVINLETNGNKEGKNNTGALTDGSDPSEDTWNQLSSGTITFCKSVNAKTEVDNVITKQYLSAFYAEKTRADYFCFNVNHAKIYDCFGTAFVIWLSGDNIVNNSEIKRFGGPVALMFCSMDSTYEDGFFNGYETAGFTIGENVVCEAPLGGTEAWFQIYGLDTYLTILKEIDPLFSGGDALDSILGLLGDYAPTLICKPYGKTFLDEDDKFNLLSFGLNRKIDGEYINIQFGVGGNSFSVDSEHTVSDNVDTTSFEDIVSAYYNSSICKITALGGLVSMTLPICATDSGKIFAPYYDSTGTDYTVTLIDLTKYFEDGTIEEVEFDETDTVLFMYYDLSVKLLGVSLMTLSFSMSVSFYDVATEEENPD